MIEDNLTVHVEKLNASYNTKLSETIDHEIITPFQVPTYVYDYSLKNPIRTTYWYPSLRVAAFGVYPTTVNFTTVVSTSESWSINVGVTSATIKKLLKLNAGVTWSNSASTGLSYEVERYMYSAYIYP